MFQNIVANFLRLLMLVKRIRLDTCLPDLRTKCPKRLGENFQPAAFGIKITK